MKLKSEILKDEKGKTISIQDYFYNDLGKIVRQDFRDNSGELQCYKTFEYDKAGNCTKTAEFSSDNKLQGSFEHNYDSNSNLTETIERADDGSIYDWTEVVYQPENNLKIWIAKDSNGKVIHKTIENTVDHSEERFNELGVVYEKHYKRLDDTGRLIEKIIVDANGSEKEKHQFIYEEKKEIWTLVLNGSTLLITYTAHRINLVFPKVLHGFIQRMLCIFIVKLC